MTPLILAIVIGLVIWLVVPLLVNDKFKKKSSKQAMSMLCKIVGIAVMAVAVVNFILGFFK